MQHRTLRRGVATGVALLVAASIAPAGARTRNLQERLQIATRYLAMNQEDDGSISGGFSRIGTTADAVLAFVSEDRGKRQVRRAIRWLEANVDAATTLGLKSKLVLAAVAAQYDPRSFGGRDLVQEIQDAYDPETGQYGGESDTEVGYHALAMLAVMAGREDPPAEASGWLRDAQCDDGGWQFDEPAGPNDDEHCFDSTAENDFARSDTNTTAYADMAFEGSPGPDPKIDPIPFLRTARDPYKKGFVYDPHGKCTDETLGEQFCYLTDANSTGLVLQAMAGEIKAKEFVPYRDALMKLQYPRCGEWMGAFAFTWVYDPETETFHKDDPNVGATIGALLGARGARLPLELDRVTEPPPNRRPCRS